jgi:simple sugar transport system permease protein
VLVKGSLVGWIFHPTQRPRRNMVMLKWHLEPRLDTTTRQRWIHTIASVAAALLVGAILLAGAGVDPLEAYVHIIRTGLLSGYAVSDTIVKATPILLCALGASVAFRMKLWNIGGEGQLLLGAWAAAGVALHWLPPTTPSLFMLLTMMLAGALAGAVTCAIAGVLRAWLHVNEIITTLMLNYVASLWVSYFVFGPWSDRGFPLTPSFPKGATLPRLTDIAASWPALGGMTAHAGAILALVASGVVSHALARTRWGFEIRVLGQNPTVGRLSGMNHARLTLTTMAVSGALCGLAGMTEVSGVVHRLQDRFSPGFGFMGIIVAWLGKLEPWRMVVVAFLFGVLLVGGKEIQPGGVPQMLQGLILFVIVGSQFWLRFKIRVARTEPTS